MIKTIPVKKIINNKEVYPRNSQDWKVAYKYAESMKAGAQFPPILVTKYNGQYLVVDGWHRLEAYKKNKEEEILAEILKLAGNKEIFIEAVKRNATHGKPLTIQERAQIILKLREFKVKERDISKITFIPYDQIEDFVINRLTYSTAGKQIVLKAPLKHLATVEVSDKIIEGQKFIASDSQLTLLNQVITLLKNNWIDLKDEQIRARLLEIFALIKDIIKKYGLRIIDKKKKKRG